jgi:hypothetical protein
MEELADAEIFDFESTANLTLEENKHLQAVRTTGDSSSSRLKINKRRQEGNPPIKYIRNVVFEWNSEIRFF